MVGLVYLSDNKWWMDTILLGDYDVSNFARENNYIKGYRVANDPHLVKKGWYKARHLTKEDGNFIFPNKMVILLDKIED